MKSEQEQEPTYLALFVALLAVSCVWVLSLPVFPSQDGPMHVYFAHVLGSLLHPGGPFAGYFYIRSYLPPYALYYYLLIALMKVFSAGTAEKLIVCLIFLLQASGFRVLARKVGAGGAIASLWFLPLLVNWPLGMGFFNFLLALGFALWALALWWAMRVRINAGRIVAYWALIALITITHPVPLLFVLSITGLELALRLLSPGQTDSLGHRLQAAQGALLAFLVSCCASFYVLHFTDRNRVAENLTRHSVTLKRVLKLSSLAFFSIDNLATYLYRLGLFAIFFGALYFAIRSSLHRPSTPAPARRWTWLIFTFVLLLFILVAPPDMNGSHHFSDRLVLVVWISALLAASVREGVSLRGGRILAIAAACAVAGVLVLGDVRIRPLANELAAMRAGAFPEAAGTTGILLGVHPSEAQLAAAQRVNFDAFQWSPGYAFTRTDTVELNPPWLDLPIIPLATKAGMLDRTFSPSLMDDPDTLYKAISRMDADRRTAVLRRGHFVLLPEIQAGSLGLLAPHSGWHCQPAFSGVLCDLDAGS